MDFEGESGSDYETDRSDSSQDGSDAELGGLEEFVLPSAVLDDDKQFMVLSGNSTESAELAQELQESAFQVIDGKLSGSEFVAAKKSSGGGKGFISPFISGLIGQANMSFVRGDYEECLRLCQEAIRADPTISEPYRTLSEMYEEMGEHEKALQLGMIAASNGGKDGESWVALGDKAIDLERPQDALYCYLKAVRVAPNLYQVFLNIIKLYDPIKDKRQIIFTYQRLVKRAPVELGAAILEYAKNGAKLCHEDNDPKTGLAIMEKAFERVPQFVTLNDVNVLIEFHSQLQNHQRVLEVISKHCDVCIEGREIDILEFGETSTDLRVDNCTINGDLPLEIRAKLLIAIIHLQGFHLTDALVTPFLDVVEEYGDVMIDIGEAFMAENRHVDALKILKILVSSVNYSAAQVWYHYAECLRKLERKEEAINAYLVVMEKAPQHTEARLYVSEMLNELGRSDEAINALVQDPSCGYLDLGMLFERCLLLKENPARSPEYLAVGRLLLSRHCSRFRNRNELINFLKVWKVHSRTELMKKYTENEEPAVYVEGKRMPTSEEEFELFKSLCKTAFDNKQYALLQRLACSGLGSKVFFACKNPENYLNAVAALALFFNKDCFAALNLYKNCVMSGFDTPRFWNIFNLLLSPTEDTRWQKYIMRLLTKKPDHFALPLIFANNCFSSGTYKQALSEYFVQFKHRPSPLLALLIAVACVHVASQKHATNVNVVVTQAMGYLAEYRQMRGEECLQEIHYNMGRLHHHLGMYPAAMYHYKKVFEIPAPCEMFDLKREAAFNLSRIYIMSNSYSLARHYVQKYMVV